MYNSMNDTTDIYNQPPVIIIPDGGITGTGVNSNGTTVSTNTTTDMTGISSPFAPCDKDYTGINTKISATTVNATNVNACNIITQDTTYKLNTDIYDVNFGYGNHNSTCIDLAFVGVDSDDVFGSDSTYHSYLMNYVCGVYTDATVYYNIRLRLLAKDSYISKKTIESNGQLVQLTTILLTFNGYKSDDAFGQQSACMEFNADHTDPHCAFGVDLAYICYKLGFTSKLFDSLMIPADQLIDKNGVMTGVDSDSRLKQTKTELLDRSIITWDFKKFVTVVGTRISDRCNGWFLGKCTAWDKGAKVNAKFNRNIEKAVNGSIMVPNEVSDTGSVTVMIRGDKDCVTIENDAWGFNNHTEFATRSDVFMGLADDRSHNPTGSFSVRMVFGDGNLIPIDERIWKRQ